VSTSTVPRAAAPGDTVPLARFGDRTDTGRVRESNQDSYACAPDLGLWLVADGMGGHQSGELASAIAVQATVEAVRAGYPLVEAIELAHRAVLAAQDLDTAGMGSTMVALRLHDSEFEVAWVGDSRVYRYDGELHALTRDHSVVQELVNAGALDPELAESHPGRNVITQALGAGEAEALRVDSVQGTLSADERFLLCSDGVHGEIGRDSIRQILASESDPQRAVDRLVEAALNAGGSDNVTAVLVRTASGLAARPTQEVPLSPTEPLAVIEEAPSPGRLRSFVVGASIGITLAIALWWALR